ncbi:hypothetical protein F8388_017674 [Cannabis sativa]|uniref:BEACH domain-containing protein B n=1 Tax=Cannabis sativa TaxID=3483 RepID=A0A7J6HI43_CANSA|nr:hypothetical protein F8388_017674 [Cannabis sativa]
MRNSINLKRQCVHLPITLVRKKWHFLCLTHSIGRAFSGGSLLRCYVDGELVSSERCRYAKVNEPLTSCKIGAKVYMAMYEDDIPQDSVKVSAPFFGQIGPVYLFNDTISPDQVRGIYSLGPSYMYSFLDNEAVPSSDNLIPTGILDVKDGLASRIIFGINAQASDGKKLFNVSPMLDYVPDRNLFEGNVMIGTQLCSRRLLQQIIYCVGGVSVFFPLIAQSDNYENEESAQFEPALTSPITSERVSADVIEIIASVLDENLANQQQMHLLSGFSILGFLLQSVPPQQLNLEMLSALKHLFNVIANCGLAELLVKDAISSIFLNPLIWIYTAYRVQRELYMFLIQQFDNDPRLLKSLCRLPRVLDIIRQFYWDNAKSQSVIGNKPLLHPVIGKVIGERPINEEIHKIRLLLLSLGEMSLRENIVAADIKALIAFCETSHDMSCIEDVLHMVIRDVSQKPLLAAFLEQVNLIGGCHLFVNLLQREYEPIRLLGLQFLGRLLVGLPSEKKGPRFFSLAVGRSRSLSEDHKKISLRLQPIFAAMADRLFRFPQTDNLCATLFDVLLGGASPKQVLQKQVNRQRSKGHNSHFFLPQILVLIFRFLSGSEDAFARVKIIRDLLDLLDSHPSNVEAFMEFGWNSWLAACIKLDVLKDYKVNSHDQDINGINEQSFVRSLFCSVLCHYMHYVKGGWQQLEETSNFLLIQCEHGSVSRHLLRDIYEDLIQRLVDLCSEENIFISQPCRDNTLYLLRLVDEMLISEIDHELPFPSSGSEFSIDTLEIERHKDYGSALYEVLQGESDSQVSRNSWSSNQPTTNEDDKWWHLYDNIWIIISEMNGKGPSKMLPKSSPQVGPSFGQRARGLVESLNIPAAEVAAVVVSGGIGSALGGKPNKNIDKAMLLRGERCPRIIFRLVIIYLCRSSLERASRCVQQCKTLNDGARFQVVSHLIRETVNCGKSVLASTIMGKDDSDAGSNLKELGSIHNLIQKDRVLIAVADETSYVKTLNTDRIRQLHDLSTRMDENSSAESNNRKAFEDDLESSLNSILASDESRRGAFQLTHEEEQQNIVEKWIHMFRALIDERGPWSANQIPDKSEKHWKLDKEEDTWRRRLKLRQNYHFDERLCHPPSSVTSDEVTVPMNDSKSGLAGNLPEQMKQFLLKGVRRITDEVISESNESDTEHSGQKASIAKDLLDSPFPELVKDSSDWVQERKDSSLISLEAESSEVLTSVPCVLITTKRKLAGRLAVKKSVLHFFGEILVEGTGGLSVFKGFHASSSSDTTKPDQKQKSLRMPIDLDLYSEKGTSADNVEDIHENELKKKQLKNIKRHRRWNISKIKAVHWTRYLLRYTAIEIFFSDSVAPVFFNFASLKDAKDVGTLIVATRNEYLFPKGSGRDKSGVISFVDRRVALVMADIARERWRKRDITNFEYLMILNTLAGRSYNDLTQYPVFPWILADYSSEILDFNKSSTFRDLSKPVGALDSKRFEVFEERYRSFSDPDIPRNLQVAVTIDAVDWIIETVKEVQQKEERRRVSFKRSFRNSSSCYLVEYFLNTKGSFLKISVLKNNMMKTVIIPEEEKANGWSEFLRCLNSTMKREQAFDNEIRAPQKAYTSNGRLLNQRSWANVVKEPWRPMTNQNSQAFGVFREQEIPKSPSRDDFEIGRRIEDERDPGHHEEVGEEERNQELGRVSGFEKDEAACSLEVEPEPVELAGSDEVSGGVDFETCLGQGGKFDHADRLFQSIEGTYRNCLSNTSDVKELIPEFFYMPEFLVNSNTYHLGVKQDGELISDVCLPPWAKGSPEEFVRKNREALESEYVSSNLHHWIDLVFGYKQRGKPAVEAGNVFYYLTYEGAVDLDTMEDDLQRSAIEDQIANFGQTPIQIFRKKHPRRGPPIPIAHPLYFAPGSINLTSIVSSTSYPSSSVLYVHILDSNIVIINQGITLSVKMWLTTQLQSGGNFTFSGSQDPFFGVGSDVLSSRKIGSPLAESVELGAQCFATMQTPSENFLISCGNWENSFQVISLNDGRMVQSIRQHKDVVSCVAVTSDGSVLATGSFDTTVMVWEVRGRNAEKKFRTAQMEFPRKDCVIVETPFHILCGHDDIITCLFVSMELDIVISGSKDGTCIFHTLREGRYVRSLRHPNNCALSKLVASQHGRIVFYADDDLSLHLYSINGKHLASSESNGRLNCVELSRCGEFLVCAGDQGQIVVRSMNSLEVIKKYNGIGKIITSLTVTPEECFLAGTKDGSLLVYSIENPQQRLGNVPRNFKSKHSVAG